MVGHACSISRRCRWTIDRATSWADAGTMPRRHSSFFILFVGSAMGCAEPGGQGFAPLPDTSDTSDTSAARRRVGRAPIVRQGAVVRSAVSARAGLRGGAGVWGSVVCRAHAASDGGVPSAISDADAGRGDRVLFAAGRGAELGIGDARATNACGWRPMIRSVIAAVIARPIWIVRRTCSARRTRSRWRAIGCRRRGSRPSRRRHRCRRW